MRGIDELRFKRGEIWLVQLDPVVGHEQAGRRPAVVVSSDEYHRLQVGLVTFVPITSWRRDWPSYVPVAGSSTGLNRSSFAMADQVRTMSADRVLRRLGHVEPSTLNEIQAFLRILLDL